MKIGILVGHGKTNNGGYDSGAVNTSLGLHEFTIAKEIAKGATSYLGDFDCTVELINYSADKSLPERIKYCNEKAIDVICEIHLNAFGGSFATGTEVYYYPSDKKGRKLADTISKAISQKLCIPQRSNGIDDGGDKASSYYGIVRETRGVAVLVETCFITTVSDIKKVDTLTEQIEVGQVIGQAIAESFELKRKTDITPDGYYIWTGTFKTEAAANKYAQMISNMQGKPYCQVRKL